VIGVLCRNNIKNGSRLNQIKYENIYLSEEIKNDISYEIEEKDKYNFASIKIKFSKSYILMIILILTFL
jgi:hypothetical protein